MASDAGRQINDSSILSRFQSSSADVMLLDFGTSSVKGSSSSPNRAPAFDVASVQRVVEEQQGELALPQRLLCRLRYFTDGVILGSQCFVESHFVRLKLKLGYKRRRPATPLTALGSPSLWVFRDPRVRTIG